MQDTEPGDTSVLTTLFAHNVWANLKLVDFCEQLTDEQLDITAIGGFGSIRDTLWHIVRADVGYVRRVTGKLPSTPVSKSQFPGFAALRDLVRWSSDELLQLALAARKDTIVRERERQQVFVYPLASLIVQSITHSTEHRAQIAAIITQLGLEPPDMSGWMYMEESGEFQEAEADADKA